MMTCVLEGAWPGRAEMVPVAPRGDGRWLGPALLASLVLWGLIAAAIALVVGLL
jgi:hypothetical protein